MSIKRRLVLSNITMIVVPTILILLMFHIMMWVFDAGGIAYKLILNTRGQHFTVLEWQMLTSGIRKAVIRGNGEIQNNPQFQQLHTTLIERGSMISITIEGENIYSSPGSSETEILGMANTMVSGNLDTQNTISFSSSSGSFYLDDIRLSDGRTGYVMIVSTAPQRGSGFSPRGDFSLALREFLRKPLSIGAVVSLLIIVFTNGILVFLTSRSILIPLGKLRNGTHQIKEGNLDFEINYVSDDELGQVCADFEEMRCRLKESVETQEKYERNRKELIAGISHDLSTPLTSIKGYLMGIKDGIANTPEKQQKYLDILYHTATDMEKLVSELFLFSKLDLNTVPFYFEKTNLLEYFADCYEEQQFELMHKDMDVKLISTSETPIYVALDRGQFRRVVLNIIENSLKYKKDEGGIIQIRVGQLEEAAVVEIADNGMGMEEDKVDKIFESFYRADPSRNNPCKGSGLGLAIARQIIERHSGKIWAASRPGQGLTIHMTLPIIRSE